MLHLAGAPHPITCVSAGRRGLSPAQHLACCFPPHLQNQAIHSLQLCVASCLQAEAAWTPCRACTTLLPAVASLRLTLRFVLVLLLPLATTCPSATKMHLNRPARKPLNTPSGCHAPGASSATMCCPQAYPMGTSSSARACLACSSTSRSCRSLVPAGTIHHTSWIASCMMLTCLCLSCSSMSSLSSVAALWRL